jgi:ribosome biogenesis protein UTP30
MSFSNIQSLHIKTTTSVSLPIYNCTLDAQGRFAGPSEDEVKAVEKRRAEKEAEEDARAQKELEREERRKERSATKEGKGRAEKKRKTPGGGAEQDVVVEEVEIPVTEPIVEATEVERPAKKAKKAKTVEVVEEVAPVAEEKVKKSKKSSKVKA